MVLSSHGTSDPLVCRKDAAGVLPFGTSSFATESSRIAPACTARRRPRSLRLSVLPSPVRAEPRRFERKRNKPSAHSIPRILEPCASSESPAESRGPSKPTSTALEVGMRHMPQSGSARHVLQLVVFGQAAKLVPQATAAAPRAHHLFYMIKRRQYGVNWSKICFSSRI